MKKTILKLALAAIIAVSTFLSSCGKYEDGPKISLKSKMARITRVWVDPACTGCGTIEFKKDGSVLANAAVVSGYAWAFSSDKKNLIITYTVGSFSGTSTDAILRLTSKEMWLQTVGSTTVDKYTAQ